jgi:hypothetical protein
VEKVLTGIDVLTKLGESAQRTQEVINYKGLQIKRLLIKSCARYYEMALKIALSEEVVHRLERLPANTMLNEIQKSLTFDDKVKNESWRDISGMIATNSSIQKFMDEIRAGKISTVNSTLEHLKAIHQEYEKTAGDWFLCKLEQRLGIEISQILPGQLIQIISDWKENRLKLNNMILKDAEKEFDFNSQIGYGLDGDTETRQLDFESVRGTFDNNTFVRDLKQESESVVVRAEKLFAKLNEL